MILPRPAPASLATATTFVLAILFLVSVSGCRKREIVTYTVPKEQAAANTPATAPASSAGNNMASTPVTTASGAALTWTAPARWEERPASAMRKATYLIPARPGDDAARTAELAVTAFPGDVGGNLANVNRWRQQLELAPISASELPQALRHLDIGSLHIDIVELIGPANAADSSIQPTRVIGAIVPVGEATWFFKLTGPDATVAAERDAFNAFIRTLRPQN